MRALVFVCLVLFGGCSQSSSTDSSTVRDLSGQPDSPAVADTTKPDSPVARKVLLIAREVSADMELMIQNEVDPIIQALTAAHFEVEVAAASGVDIPAGQTTLKVDMKLTEVKVSEYEGIVIPCMAAGGTQYTVPSKAVDLVKQAGQDDLPMAAQQSGVIILGEAGVLQGKNYAIASVNQNAAWGGTYQGEGVVVDGKIVTSGICPYIAAQTGTQAGTDEMLSRFIALLE